MAKLTTKEKNIVEMYVRYFGKTPSVDEISKYSEFKTKSAITKEIRLDSDVENNSLTNLEYVENAIQNLFGRPATTNEKKYAVKKDNNPNYVLPIATILKKGSSVDKAVYNTKKLVAQMFAEEESTVAYNLDNITRENYSSIYNTKTKKLLITTSTELETKLVEVPDNITGKTFTLTTGDDTGKEFTGTAKNDLFKAGESIVGVNGGAEVYVSHLNNVDELDGGAGKDYLDVTTNSKIESVNATIKNIEVINLKSGAEVEFDTTTYEGVETLNVKKATATAAAPAVDVTASATTNVNVSGVTKGDIEVAGGKNVVVNDATEGNKITVDGAVGTITVTDTKNAGGAAANNNIVIDGGTDVTVTATADKAASGAISVDNATGNVKVTQNVTSDATVATFAAGNVTVDGAGKTIEITANLTNTAVKGAAAAGNITAGIYSATAGDTTTDVTITQNVTATDFENDAAAAVTQVETVTFGALKSGETVNVKIGAGPGLTFTAAKDLTAAEVAAAFANLKAVDTQSATGTIANGIYSGKLDTGITSGVVSGSTVTFTATTAGVVAAGNLAVTTTGSAAGLAVDDANFVATVVTAGAAAALPSTAVNVTEDFGDVVVNDNATKSITTITLDGFDNATLGDTIGTGSLDKLATLNLTNGQGSVAGTVLTSTVSTLTVNVDDMAGTVNLGSALKTLNLNANGAESTIALDAGAVETLTINATADLTLSTGSDIDASKSITVKGAGKVDLGDISGATTLNTFNASANTGGVTATIETTDATLTGTITEYVFSAGNDNVTLKNGAVDVKVALGDGNDTISLATGTTIANVASTIDGGKGTNTIAMDAADAVTLSSNDTFEGKISNFSQLSLGINAVVAGATVNLANLDDINYVISAGSSTALTLTDMANNGTLELTGALTGTLGTHDLTVTMENATGNADKFNIVTKVDANITNTAAVVVAGVETINVTATDISPVDLLGEPSINTSTLILTATSATTVNVAGNSNIDLDTDTAGTANLKTVDASTLEGALTYTLESTVKGVKLTSGKGADTITIGATDDAQVKTGLGDDKIIVEADAVSANIWGGAGNDIFDVTDAISSETQYVTIEDATAGDQIILDTNKFINGGVTITDFDQMTLTDKFNAVLGDTGLNIGNSFAISFTHANNTYIVVSDGTAGSSFGAAGTDQVIKLTGIKDLSAGASFNIDGTLEIA